MELQEAVQDYLRYIEYERGLAKTTISASATTSPCALIPGSRTFYL